MRIWCNGFAVAAAVILLTWSEPGYAQIRLDSRLLLNGFSAEGTGKCLNGNAFTIFTYAPNDYLIENPQVTATLLGTDSPARAAILSNIAAYLETPAHKADPNYFATTVEAAKRLSCGGSTVLSIDFPGPKTVPVGVAGQQRPTVLSEGYFAEGIAQCYDGNYFYHSTQADTAYLRANPDALPILLRSTLDLDRQQLLRNIAQYIASPYYRGKTAAQAAQDRCKERRSTLFTIFYAYGDLIALPGESKLGRN